MIKLIKRLEDEITIGRMWIDDDDGLPSPRAEINGIVCDILTKQALLDAGIASCNPIDDTPDSQWPMQCLVLLTNDDGTTEERTLDAVSADPRLVVAAKKFVELLSKDPNKLIGKDL